jgi:hypothetical protein
VSRWTEEVDVKVLAALPSSVASVGTLDPCKGIYCKNGGRCVAKGMTRWCDCPKPPALAFFGAMCEFSVLACPNCMTQYERGGPLRLYGVELSKVTQVRIGGRITGFSRAVASNASWPGVAEALAMIAAMGYNGPVEQMEFLAPALVPWNYSQIAANGAAPPLMASYVPISIHTSVQAAMRANVVLPGRRRLLVDPGSGGGGGSDVLSLNLTSMLFYSAMNCSDDTPFAENGQCVACPEGGYWFVETACASATDSA